MNRGYVKLWRKSFDSGLMSNANLWLCWTWCLLKASHKKTKVLVGFQEVSLEPGQFVFGRHKAAAALNLSERNVRTCFEALKNAGRIAIETTNKYSIISIIKWSDYQSDEISNDQQNDQQSVQPLTSKRPASDQQATTNKNVKNEKNISIAETNVSSNGNCPYEKIKDLYHSILSDLPSVRILTDKRKSYIKARWEQKFALRDGTLSNTLEFWEKYFNYIRESPFLMGQVDPQPGRNRFQADLEWITNLSNFTKILERKYHN